MTRTVGASEVKPLLRGVVHQAAFFAAAVAGMLLVVGTSGIRNQVAAAIFTGAALAMFGASALYHRVRWGVAAGRWMRRVDHAGVYLMIAGSYTAYGLLVLSGAWRVAVLAVVWGGVTAAIALRFIWVDAPGWLGATLGVSIGWAGAVALPKAFPVLGLTGFALLLAGGLLYTAGGIVYAVRRPNPFPRAFGFHEVFHALVVVAVACQYTALALVLLPA